MMNFSGAPRQKEGSAPSQVEFDKKAVLDRINYRAFYESELNLDLGPTTSDGWTRNVSSPFREDSNPSCGFNLNTGQWNDFGGESGDAFDFDMKKYGVDFPTALRRLAEFAGMTGGQSFPGKTLKPTARTFNHWQLGIPVKAYPYTDESGKILYFVCRFEPKNFRPCDPSGNWKTKGIKHVPYNLPSLKKSDTVFLTEGEKDADRLNSLGLVATCKANWTGKWSLGFAEEFFTGKTIYILQDNDQAGSDKAQDAFESLKKVQGTQIKVIPPFRGNND